MIQAEFKEQDDLLDGLSGALDGLMATTRGINDELDLQNAMLEELETKVDKTQSTLDGVNSRMDDALKIVNSKSSKFCSYVICLIVLLGVLTVGYNALSSGDSDKK